MKTRKEIEDLLNRAVEAADRPRLHGMTFEEGVRDALSWVLGEMGEDETPLD